MRNWLPALRTEPSSMWATFSCTATVGISISLPLKANADDRDVTRSSGIFASRLSNSAAIPSDIYSWSLLGDMSTNGRTAIDLFPYDPTRASVRPSCRAESAIAASRDSESTNLSNAKYPSASASASASAITMMQSRNLPVFNGTDRDRSKSLSLFSPSGVSSNTQAKTSTGIRPIARADIT